MNAIIQDLKKQPSLQSLLSGIQADYLSNEEVILMYIWTRPLVTSINNNDEYSIYARGILGVDVIQAQGLLRNCEKNENNLINVVETFFKLARTHSIEEYEAILKKAVYSSEKATEVRLTLEVLGDNWFNFKE